MGDGPASVLTLSNMYHLDLFSINSTVKTITEFFSQDSNAISKVAVDLPNEKMINLIGQDDKVLHHPAKLDQVGTTLLEKVNCS